MTAKGKEIRLLEKACSDLGLMAVREPEGGYGVYDREGDAYACVFGAASAPQRLRGMGDFLRTVYFEHYRFPGILKVVENRFTGMSREEVELRLAVGA